VVRKPVTAIFFDWDGTLCDSAAASLRAFRKSLAEFGITFTDARYKAIFTPAWYRMYEALGLPQESWHDADRCWLDHYACEEPALLPGAAAVLEDLGRRGLTLGIVTSGTRLRVLRELERFQLDGTFRAVVCWEDVALRKPHPEGLEKALALAGCGRETCWYVGDTPEDIEMGRGAGLFTVGVPSDYIDPARLAACAPDLLLNSIRELPGAVADEGFIADR
jgi:HAD superfamily hydrolase (TIGR01549 family)